MCQEADTLEAEIGAGRSSDANLTLGYVIDDVAKSADEATPEIRSDAARLVALRSNPALGNGPSSPENIAIRDRVISFVDKTCDTKLSGKIPANGHFEN